MSKFTYKILMELLQIQALRKRLIINGLSKLDSQLMVKPEVAKRLLSSSNKYNRLTHQKIIAEANAEEKTTKRTR